MHSFTGEEFMHHAVNRYSDMLIRIAFQYARSRADAEDIAQGVFIALLKQPPFHDETHLKAWLIRAAINKSQDYLRAAKRRNAVPLGHAANRLTQKQAEMLEELQELPENDRNILYLFYYEGYSAKEITQIIGIKEKAVLMRLSRAREKLKALLEKKP